jgi:hypothetical protein
MLISVGIDNGLSGAVVAIDENFEVLGWWDCPTTESTTKASGKIKHHREFSPRGMKDILEEIINLSGHLEVNKTTFIRIWLEFAHAMPKQGVTSTFKTGKGAGLWEGIVVGMGLAYDIVHPRTWTKNVLADVPRGDPKQRSFIKCERLFPSIPLTKPSGRVLSMDGRSDASLIAYHGMLIMKGEPGPKKKTKKKPAKAKIKRTPVKKKDTW